ncbi:MAG: GNVR domain-containing protein [Thermodesulfobacteriota bacterium]
MEQQQRQLIKKYLDIVLRRKKVIIAFFLLGLVAGLGLYLTTPKVYLCTSLIQYQRQQVNPTAMSPDDVRSRTSEVVATVSQQITSRSSLEAMIKEFDLYADLRAALPMEDVVDLMRNKHIEIKQEKGDIFKVSYQGGDPRKVLRVTNALAAKFIEENLRYREERASETSTYIKDELRMAKEALDQKEAVMRDYKLKYYNEMPSQLANNMSRLNALQDQYQKNQDSYQQMEQTRVMIQEQISLRQEMVAQQLQGAAIVAGSDKGVKTQGPAAEINALRQTLRNLQSRYTEQHPEVRRVKKQLEELEGRYAGAAPEEGTAAVPLAPIDPQIEQMKVQLQEIEFNVVRLRSDRAEIEKEIRKYQQWIDATPIREAEWAGLTRDYEQLNQHYQALVGQSLQAESAHSLEKQQKGSQFKIVDPAHFPEKPYKPDFRKIMLLAIALGLGLGGGLAFGVELLNTSFKEPEEVEAFLCLPILCAIPVIHTRAEARRQRLITIAWGLLLGLSATGILVALAYCWKKGLIVL